MIFHYVRWDEPNANTRLARAVCGQLVDPKREHAAEPTCPDCATWLRDTDAMDFGEPTPGTQVQIPDFDPTAGYRPRGARR